MFYLFISPNSCRLFLAAYYIFPEPCTYFNGSNFSIYFWTRTNTHLIVSGSNLFLPPNTQGVKKYLVGAGNEPRSPCYHRTMFQLAWYGFDCDSEASCSIIVLLISFKQDSNPGRSDSTPPPIHFVCISMSRPKMTHTKVKVKAS